MSLTSRLQPAERGWLWPGLWAVGWEGRVHDLGEGTVKMISEKQDVGGRQNGLPPRALSCPSKSHSHLCRGLFSLMSVLIRDERGKRGGALMLGPLERVARTCSLQALAHTKRSLHREEIEGESCRPACRLCSSVFGLSCVLKAEWRGQHSALARSTISGRRHEYSRAEGRRRGLCTKRK